MTTYGAHNHTGSGSPASPTDPESWLHSALECAGMGAWRAWPETGQFEATAAAKRLHGLPDDAPLDQALAMDVIHPEDRDRVKSALQRAVDRGEPYHAEFRTRLPDGSTPPPSTAL